jgi:hypothetical protein
MACDHLCIWWSTPRLFVANKQSKGTGYVT